MTTEQIKPSADWILLQRRTASWMPNGATEAAASGMKEPGFGQPPAQDTMSGGAACNNLPAGCLPEGKPQSSLGPDSCNMLQQAAQVGFNPYFPFGKTSSIQDISHGCFPSASYQSQNLLRDDAIQQCICHEALSTTQFYNKL